MKKKYKKFDGAGKNGQGQCKICGSLALEYGAVELEGEQLHYPYTCLNCGNHGKEWYSLTYVESE
jgi:hypothetical protein